MLNRYLTARETAELLRLNVESIYDMAASGEIPASKIRGRWRFDADEIRDWFREQRPTLAAEAREA